MHTQTGTHVYLPSSCLEGPSPKPIPRGPVLNKKLSVRIQNTILALEAMVFVAGPDKTNAINSNFNVSFQTAGKTSGKTLKLFISQFQM